MPAEGHPSYFPLQPGPLRMVAGLHRHGTDFGQGGWDTCFFQRDARCERYLAEKRRAPASAHQIHGDDPAARAARGAALSWMRESLAREAPGALAAADGTEARDGIEALALSVQEDLAVLHDDGTRDRLVALDIRFPAGFAPERLAGASFLRTHGPVPDFADAPAVARSMVEAMVRRGPYVRFVWSLSADERLDHHPERWAGHDFSSAGRLFFRVERQCTIPLPAADAALFLIRTHLYDVGELSAAQRALLLRVLSELPEAVRRYKGLPDVEAVRAWLEPGGGTPA